MHLHERGREGEIFPFARLNKVDNALPLSPSLSLRTTFKGAFEFEPRLNLSFSHFPGKHFSIGHRRKAQCSAWGCKFPLFAGARSRNLLAVYCITYGISITPPPSSVLTIASRSTITLFCPDHKNSTCPQPQATSRVGLSTQRLSITKLWNLLIS